MRFGAAGHIRSMQSRDGQVDLWLLRPETVAPDAALCRYLGWLSDDECRRRQRFYFDQDRHRFLLTRALVRGVLSRYAGQPPERWRFTTNAYGRPELLDPPPGVPQFNLSHTEGLIVCAISAGGQLGVDAERVVPERARIDLARRFFAPSEADAIERTAGPRQAERFFEFWTLKESYIKARGLGLALPLGSFAFELSDDRPPRLVCAPRCGDTPAGWRFGRVRLFGSHQLAFALRAESAELAVVVRETIPDDWVSPPRPLPPNERLCWSIDDWPSDVEAVNPARRFDRRDS